jgi:hypothetical protein
MHVQIFISSPASLNGLDILPHHTSFWLFGAFPSNHFTPFVGNRQETFPNLISNYHVVKDANKGQVGGAVCSALLDNVEPLSLPLYTGKFERHPSCVTPVATGDLSQSGLK